MIGGMTRLGTTVAVLLAVSAPAVANDSIAEVRPGGLVFVRTDAISMESEDLYVSMDEIRVDYRFLNTSDEDVTATVAFPMPDIEGNPWVMPMIPDPDSANYLSFEVVQDGVPIEADLQQRVFAAGVDRTDLLEEAGVPLEPYAAETEAAIARLPDEIRRDWVLKGLLVVDVYDDDGTGMKEHFMPFWTLKTTYHWETTFPAGEEVSVSHRYSPSVGASVGLTFLEEGRLAGETFRTYVDRYCLEEGFQRAVLKSIPPGDPWGSPFQENHFAYVLTTGNNWAGPIKRFRLTVDKGKPENLVSFCGEGVVKTGPTTFTMEATDFYPARDLDVLILTKMSNN